MAAGIAACSWSWAGAIVIDDLESCVCDAHGIIVADAYAWNGIASNNSQTTRNRSSAVMAGMVSQPTPQPILPPNTTAGIHRAATAPPSAQASRTSGLAMMLSICRTASSQADAMASSSLSRTNCIVAPSNTSTPSALARAMSQLALHLPAPLGSATGMISQPL